MIDLTNTKEFDWNELLELYKKRFITLPTFQELTDFVVEHMKQFYVFVAADPRYVNTPWAYKTIGEVTGKPEIGYYTPENFAQAFKAYHLQYCADQMVKRANIQKIYENSPNRAQVQRVVSNPDPNYEQNPKVFNVFSGLTYTKEEGLAAYRKNPELVEPFLKHLKALNNIPLYHNFTLDWMASVIQFPHRVLHSWIIFVGPQGFGKSLLIIIFLELFGNFGYKNERLSFLQNWNNIIDNKILLFLDEVKLNDKDLSTINTWVTEKTKTTKAKYKDDNYRLNYLHLIASTDSISNIKLASSKNRRFFFYSCLNADFTELVGSSAPNKEYFRKFANTYKVNSDAHKALYGYFLSYPISPEFDLGQDPPQSDIHQNFVKDESTVVRWWRYCLYVGKHTEYSDLQDLASDQIVFTYKDGRVLDDNMQLTSTWIREIMQETFYKSYVKWCQEKNVEAKTEKILINEIKMFTNLTENTYGRQGNKQTLKHRIKVFQNGITKPTLKKYIILPALDDAREIFNSRVDIKWNQCEDDIVQEESEWYTIPIIPQLQEISQVPQEIQQPQIPQVPQILQVPQIPQIQEEVIELPINQVKKKFPWRKLVKK